MNTKLTKNDMARVIVQALYNLKSLPPADHFSVLRTAKRKKETLVDHYNLAHKILSDSLK
jgi:hypothetical protein